MPAGYQELILEQGTSFNSYITLDDVTGAAYNLVNYSVTSQIKKSYYTSNVTASFSASAYDPANGVILLTMTAPVSANIAAGRYVYDVKIIASDDSANGTFRVLEGIVNVLPQVTR
jgi:hypothetical protein